jgi:hypothetical protein
LVILLGCCNPPGVNPLQEMFRVNEQEVEKVAEERAKDDRANKESQFTLTAAGDTPTDSGSSTPQLVLPSHAQLAALAAAKGAAKNGKNDDKRNGEPTSQSATATPNLSSVEASAKKGAVPKLTLEEEAKLIVEQQEQDKKEHERAEWSMLALAGGKVKVPEWHRGTVAAGGATNLHDDDPLAQGMGMGIAGDDVSSDEDIDSDGDELDELPEISVQALAKQLKPQIRRTNDPKLNAIAESPLGSPALRSPGGSDNSPSGDTGMGMGAAGMFGARGGALVRSETKDSFISGNYGSSSTPKPQASPPPFLPGGGKKKLRRKKSSRKKSGSKKGEKKKAAVNTSGIGIMVHGGAGTTAPSTSSFVSTSYSSHGPIPPPLIPAHVGMSFEEHAHFAATPSPGGDLDTPQPRTWPPPFTTAATNNATANSSSSSSQQQQQGGAAPQHQPPASGISLPVLHFDD